MSKRFSSLYRCNVVTRLSSCLVALLLLSPTNADGDTLLYEGFDYGGALNDGDAVAGQNGGTGSWSGAWINLDTGTHNFEDPGLTYTNGGTLPVSGGAFIDELAADGGPSSIRPIDANLIGDDATVWVSYLFRADNTTRFMRMSFDGIMIWGGGDGVVARFGSSGAVVGNFGVGETHLVVGRLVTSTAVDDVLDVWVDVPLNVVDIDALTSSTMSGTWSSTDTLGISSGNAALHTFDEFRMGDSLADVLGGAVIPEPNTFTLCALGLLGLLGWGRRRRRQQAS